MPTTPSDPGPAAESPRAPFQFSIRGLMGIVLGMAAFLFLLRAVIVDRQAHKLSDQCLGHLKEIGIALHNYHADYGVFPPAYVADASGRPLHSWRVLILPYLEQKPLYNRYNFSEPWDGPNNRRLASQMPGVY